MVEVMIAIVVLLVAATAAFSSQMTSMRLVKQSREMGVALSDLQACMEAVRMRPVEQLPIAGSPFAHGVEVAAYHGLHLREERLIATYPGYTPGGAIPEPLPIVLTATWTDERGGQRTMRLQTVRAR
ncbi:MAG: type II secretion system protein [Planctomycetes bacterium]|nr:type II secretion system protein [Planctomycetota bacterium]